jgi:hypothetical protein
MGTWTQTTSKCLFVCFFIASRGILWHPADDHFSAVDFCLFVLSCTRNCSAIWRLSPVLVTRLHIKTYVYHLRLLAVNVLISATSAATQAFVFKVIFKRHVTFTYKCRALVKRGDTSYRLEVPGARVGLKSTASRSWALPLSHRDKLHQDLMHQNRYWQIIFGSGPKCLDIFLGLLHVVPAFRNTNHGSFGYDLKNGSPVLQ